MNNPSSFSSRWRPGGAQEESFLTVRDWIFFKPFKSKLLVIYPLIIFWRHFCLTSFVIVRIIIWRLLCQRTSLAKLLANIKGAVWFMWQQQQSTFFFFKTDFVRQQIYDFSNYGNVGATSWKCIKVCLNGIKRLDWNLPRNSKVLNFCTTSLTFYTKCYEASFVAFDYLIKPPPKVFYLTNYC